MKSLSEKPEPPPLRQPDPKCKHENFSAFVDCHRITKSDSPNASPHIFTAEVRIQCVACGGDFMFDGIPWAISLERPCVNVSRTQVTLPLKPWDGALASGTCRVEIPK